MKIYKEKPSKILLVDDEQMIREYLETILHDAGFVTSKVRNGVEAVREIDDFKPDVILLDYMMPEMNGLDVLKHVTSRHEKIPCIILTGKGSEELAVTMLKEGAFDYLTKPFKADDLLKSVNRAIELGSLGTDSLKYSSQELVFLKQENNFLKQQLKFMRKVLQMDHEGDQMLEGLSKKLLEIDMESLHRNRQLTEEELALLKRLSEMDDAIEIDPPSDSGDENRR